MLSGKLILVIALLLVNCALFYVWVNCNSFFGGAKQRNLAGSVFGLKQDTTASVTCTRVTKYGMIVNWVIITILVIFMAIRMGQRGGFKL